MDRFNLARPLSFGGNYNRDNHDGLNAIDGIGEEEYVPRDMDGYNRKLNFGPINQLPYPIFHRPLSIPVFPQQLATNYHLFNYGNDENTNRKPIYEYKLNNFNNAAGPHQQQSIQHDSTSTLKEQQQSVNQHPSLKRAIDSIGGANLLKRAVDRIGGGHLLKRR